MNKKTFKFGILATALLISGCTTIQQEPQRAQRTSATISAPKNTVWPLLVSEVALKYPVQAIEKDSGLITTQFVNIPVGFNNMGMERYIFKPGGFMATWKGLRMNMQIMVIETVPGKTIINITAHYEVFENNMKNTWIVARSNGSTENSILTNIQTHF